MMHRMRVRFLMLAAALFALPGPAALATHTSAPVLALERVAVAGGEPVQVAGRIYYDGAPAASVLVEIRDRPAAGKPFSAGFVRSDDAGDFRLTLKLPRAPGTYVLEVVSHCQDVLRHLCTFRSATMTAIVGAAGTKRE
ncbi:MAG: DUF4198 domain-containing protein [Betaproteobacteria bacterium]|nr:DUF4198 domain-containing protein [Betaproteobacteria bacterium]